MSAASLFRDVAAFSVQVAFVVLVAAGLLRVIRIPARARYVCLRLTLLACLVVPWTMRSVVVVTDAPASATAPQPAVPAEAPASASAPDPSPIAGRPWQAPDLPWTTLAIAALLAGVAARAIFLAIGFFRLGQLTRRAVPIESAEYAAVQEQLGTAATISEADRLSQPVTFGFRHPVVMLPDSLAAAPPPLRRAVVTHELFHVRRGDWLSQLGEEAVRTVFWFHPAIHWLTSSIQLAREEIVDELTVRATGDRRAYMQALLAFADSAGLQGAPAFAQRRQLFHRILSVSKERVMSAPRIVMSAAALAVAVGAASWYAGSVFPIVRASRIELPAVSLAPIDGGWLIAEPHVVTVYARQRDAAAGDRDEPNEVTPENPIPRRNRGASPAYPDVAGPRPEVVVNTLVRIGREGAVTNVFDKGCSVHFGGRLLDRRPVSDGVCSRFFESAAGAIRQWRYDRPVRGPLQFTVAVTFRPEADATVAQSPSEWANYIRETQESLRQLSQETSGIAPVSQEDFERNLRAIAEQEQASVEALRQRLRDLSNRLREVERAERIAAEAGQPDRIQLQEQLALINDDLVDLQRALAHTRVQSSDIERAGAELTQAQDALRAARIAEQNARDAEIQRTTREANVRELAERGLIAPTEVQRILAQQRLLVAPSGRTPIRISDLPGVKPPTVVKRVNPAHPPVAMQARVSGTVVLEALVDERGRVADARVIRSIPLLDQAALDAARQWEFTSTVVNGEAVPVLVMLEMTFSLK
jgi:TonB family protein